MYMGTVFTITINCIYLSTHHYTMSSVLKHCTRSSHEMWQNMVLANLNSMSSMVVLVSGPPHSTELMVSNLTTADEELLSPLHVTLNESRL